MLYFTQLIYIKDGQEDVFNQFEDVAIPLIAKHHGKLLLRVRPTEQTMVAGTMERPYVIHLVSFETETDFLNFANDNERKQFLHLKEQAIRSVLLVKGAEVG